MGRPWADHGQNSMFVDATMKTLAAECGCALWPEQALLNWNGRQNELDCLSNLTNGGTLAVVKLQAAVCQDLQHHSPSQHSVLFTPQTRHTCKVSSSDKQTNKQSA